MVWWVSMGMVRARWAALFAGVLLLAGCDRDPRELGITGPYPDGVQSVTLVRPKARADLRAESPGLLSEPLSNAKYIPLDRPPGQAPTGRYYGYNY
jgi:hypothetical protein